MRKWNNICYHELLNTEACVRRYQEIPIIRVNNDSTEILGIVVYPQNIAAKGNFVPNLSLYNHLELKFALLHHFAASVFHLKRKFDVNSQAKNSKKKKWNRSAEGSAKINSNLACLILFTDLNSDTQEAQKIKSCYKTRQKLRSILWAFYYHWSSTIFYYPQRFRLSQRPWHNLH